MKTEVESSTSDHGKSFSNNEIEYSNPSEGTPNSDLKVLSKHKHRESDQKESYENNNMDLDSVRSNRDNDEISELSKQTKSNVFSELSKASKSEKKGLYNTLDVASLAKLRRIFGSEQLIREYKTSETHFQDHDVNFDSDYKLKSDDYEGIIKREVLKEDLFLDYNDENYAYHGNAIPINLIYSPKEESKNGKSQDFMATSELIDLFTSEGVHKQSFFDSVDEKEHTQTLFEKNPVKDFTMNKIKEILDDKDFDEVQKLRKSAVSYRASVEKKLLVKLHGKDSPTKITTKRSDIEKWVDRELKDIYEDTEEDKAKQKAFKIICDTNIQTDRIFDLIHKITTNDSNPRTQRNLLLERNTIDDLLKTDSDK
jgi:hypothetical protein